MAEIVAVVEHVASLTAAAAAFQIAPDVPEAQAGNAALVAAADEQSAGDAAPTLREIAAWSRAVLDIAHVPAIWRILAHQPRLLETTWRKDGLVRTGGAVDERTKASVALAVAQSRQSPYWIAYFTHLLRVRHGLDDCALVEIAGAVMHYVSFNTIAHGMRLHPPVAEMTAADVAPGGALEQALPGVRRRPLGGTLPSER